MIKEFIFIKFNNFTLSFIINNEDIKPNYKYYRALEKRNFKTLKINLTQKF